SNVGHVHGLVYVDVVVDVCDLRAIHDDRVRHVHAFDVAFADVIGRAVNVARTEREPRHSNGWRATDGHTHSPMRSANPSDERRCVNRSNIGNGHDGRTRRDGNPAPHSANNDPAAVVKWREAPWRVVYPSPAPRRDISPMAVTIWRPANNGRM